MSYEVKRDDNLVGYAKKREEMLTEKESTETELYKIFPTSIKARLFSGDKEHLINKIEQYENLRIELVQKLCKEIDNCNARIDMYNRILLEKD